MSHDAHATAGLATNAGTPPGRLRWRVVDIVTASVLAVAVGVVFWGWGFASDVVVVPLKALAPGVQAFPYAIWLLGGVLGGLVIRKPGSAVYVELVAATVEALLGTHWGIVTLLSGLAEGLGAELVFAIFLYRVWSLPVAWLAGAGAGVAMVAVDLTVYYGWSVSPTFTTSYVVSGVVGGAALTGTLSWVFVRALGGTGALSRFDAGRDGRLV